MPGAIYLGNLKSASTSGTMAADHINHANQKAGEALRNSCVDAPRQEWGKAYVCIGGQVRENGTVEWLFLTPAGYDAFDEAVDRLLKVDDFAQSVGRSAIGSQLSEFLRHCNGKTPKEGLLRAFKLEVVIPLRQNIHNWTCLIPLVNFRVKTSLTIDSVTFLSKEDACRELHSTVGMTQAEALLEELECVQDEDRVDAFAMANINSHEMHRIRRAEETVLVVVNMLRAFAPRLNPFSHALLCGLRTEVPRSCSHSVLSVRRGTDIADIRHQDDGSVLGNFQICDETLQQLREECQFDNLTTIAAKSSVLRTSLESAIFTAVQTLGQSMVAGSVGPAFSACVAAMECLAVPADKPERIKATFAKNLKWLFGNEHKAKDMYALRSDFVHTGLADIAVTDLKDSRRYDIELIIRALFHINITKEHTDFLSQCLNR